MPNRVIAACDGACKNNPGPAGWGWVIADSDERVVRWACGPLGDATNNIAELTALQQLLLAVDPDADLEIRMDSQYAIDAVTKWLPGWKANGWKTVAKKPVANRDIIEAIDGLLAGRTVRFVHVAAHQEDGDILNALADRAANAAKNSQQAAGGVSADDVPQEPDNVEPRRRRSAAQASGSPGITMKPSKRRVNRDGAARRPDGPCAICRRPIGGAQWKLSKSGKPCHASCLQQATQAGQHSAMPAAPAGQAAAKAQPQGAGPGKTALYPGTCPTCEKPYPVGTQVTKISGKWGHTACAGGAVDFERNRQAVLSGETFRSRARSAWRLGSSPSSSRERR